MTLYKICIKTDKEREKIESTYNAKTKTWEDQLAEKEKQVELLQRELHAVKEFRKQKAQLMEEIKDMRNELEQQRNLNTKNKQKMEHKFFVEKMKMENEVNFGRTIFRRSKITSAKLSFASKDLKFIIFY